MRTGHAHLGVDADANVIVGYLAERRPGTPLELGPGARLRSGTVLYGGSRIGERFTTGHHVVVREDCQIGDDVCIWTGSVVDYGCRIGNGVKIHTNCYIAQYSVLEDNVFLAPGVAFANDLVPGSANSAALMQGPYVGKGAQIGVNTTVLPYVRIGDGAIVGAGSVVTRDIPSGSVAYGNPARPVRPVSELTDNRGRAWTRRREPDDAGGAGPLRGL
jgi:acetyltransferase-like isoleucine patch superfamily enzyme